MGNLILSRKVGEKIILTMDDVRTEITIIQKNRDGTLRVGVNAPPSVTIHREEVQNAIDAQADGRGLAGSLGRS